MDLKDHITNMAREETIKERCERYSRYARLWRGVPECEEGKRLIERLTVNGPFTIEDLYNIAILQWSGLDLQKRIESTEHMKDMAKVN